MSKIVKKIATAVAVVAAVVFTGGTALLATIGKALVTAAVSIGVSRLIAKRANTSADAGGDGGARIQLPPATSNKLPIIYGTAFVGGSITDAMLSTDQKTMWYVIALAEVSDDQGGGGGSYLFDEGKCYYDGKQIQFGTNGAVTGLITNTSTPQTDTRCNGFLYVYLFNNGSSSGINTGGQTAYDILSTINGVPASKAWTAGQQTMTNCAFAIVKVIYNTDAGTTGVGQLMVNITNTLTKPGDCILDYMLNERYGCGLPLDSIDTTSLTDLNTYSDALIDYKPVNWNPGDPYSQQARYSINGPLDTGQNCLNNLQFLVDSADSWLQYSELTGKWKVVINKLYTGYPTVTGLFLVDSSNLIGGIEVSPIDLNETYNQIEVAYPNTNIKDQTDYYIIDLFEDDPQLLSPNEAINRLNVTLPLVNNAVQARYLAARRIYQSREDLVIAFRLDYSGIQVEAGDIIRVTHEVYGWTDKLFRVNNVAESKDDTGNLFADIQAFEYSDQIYDDIVEDYVPAFNTGLSDPNVISEPGTPVISVSNTANGQISSFDVTSYVPENGIILYMDFNYGTSSNVLTHRLYRTIQQSNSAPYINSSNVNTNTAVYTNVSVNVNDLQTGNYYWSVTARNNTSGKKSNSSALLTWFGANVIDTLQNEFCNVNSNGNIITGNFIISNSYFGSNVYFLNGNAGNLNSNTFISNIISSNSFEISPGPVSPLVDACINLQNGGVRGNQVQNNTIAYTNINATATPRERIDTVIFDTADPAANTVTLPVAPNANVILNVPIYIDGTTTDSNYWYPYVTGFSTTANGYIANSTAPYYPANASIQVLSQLQDNYVGFIYSNIEATSSYPLKFDESVLISIGVTLLSNADTVIKLSPFVMTNLTGGGFIHDTSEEGTNILIGGMPVNVEFNAMYQLNSPTDAFTGAGALIKNMVSNTRVEIQYATCETFKVRIT